LPQGALDDEQDAVETFRWWIDTALSQAALWSPDGADEAQLVYHALRYEGLVNNGGHVQFVAGCDGRIGLLKVAVDGLWLIGAQPFVTIAERLVSWTESHPAEVSHMLDASQPAMFRPPLLDELDGQFFTLSDQRTIRNFAFTWLCQSPGVQLLPQDEFHQVISALQGTRRA
jgi:hypothetical protein